MPDVSPRLPSRPLRWPDAVLELRDLIADVESPAYLVGGVVRDALLGRPTRDIDIITEQGIGLARLIANRMNGDFFPLDSERDVGRALVDTPEGRLQIDVAHFRADSLEADLADRDFRLNAMAADLHGDLSLLIDPLGGEQDAIDHLIRRCNPASISRDPIRALRAVRQSVKLAARIEAETKADLRAAAPHLYDTSPERVRDEFMKILGLDKVSQALTVADTLGLLAVIVPETVALHDLKQPAPHVFDGWRHTLAVVENLIGIFHVLSPGRSDQAAAQFSFGMTAVALDRFSPQLRLHLDRTYPEGRTHRALLCLAALLHDTGKPLVAAVDASGQPHFPHHEDHSAAIAQQRALALRLSNAERQRLVTITQNHMRPLWLDDVSPLSVHRFWRATGDAGVDVCLLALADYLGTFGMTLPQDAWVRYLERIRALLEAYFDHYDTLVQPPVLIDGGGLISTLGLKPGPIIGVLLDLIREGQVVGAITSADDALRAARDYLAQA